MKRKILIAIALTVVLALSLFTAACGPYDGIPLSDFTFKVTTKFDAEKGSISVADEKGEQKTSFRGGTKVVVTVAANEGYEVDTFTVNGVAAELTDGVYDFDIKGTTVVEATFKQSGGDKPGPDDDKTPEELFAEAFESVQTTFMAVGSYTYKEADRDPHVNNITTVFGTGAVNIIETDGETGEVLYDSVYVDKDGFIAEPYHTIDNKIEYNYPEGGEQFKGYDNPFKNLTTADFTATETANVFALDEDKAGDVATAITGWYEGIATFTVTIGGGKIVKLNFTTRRIVSSTTSYVSEYAFTLSAWGTAEVDEEALAPYKTTAATTALKNALKAAGEAKNYTLHIYEQEAGYEDLEYDVYVTETAIYDSCAGWEAGYVELNIKPDDGGEMLVYPFRIGDEEDGPEKDGKVVISDAVNYPTVKSMRADFTGFAPEIFENDGDVYTLHSDCIEYTDDVLVHFADGADNIMLYRDYALSVQITLRDGKLYQVELYYYVYGALVKRTVTYSEWDSTAMPISFDDWVKESVLDDYVGTYTDGADDKATLVLKITNEQITINNYPVEILDYDYQTAMFTVSYQGQTCYIRSMSQKQLVALIGDKLYNLTNIEIEPVTIPTEFNGHWKDTDGNSVTIAYDKVMFGANMLKVLSYDENEGLIAVRGKVTYGMTVGDKPNTLVVESINGDLIRTQYTLTKDVTAVILPEEFVGTYAYFNVSDMVDYKVVITLTGVTVKMNNDQTVATDVEVTTDSVKGTVLSFKLGDADCVIAKQNYGSGINFVCGAVDVNIPQTEDDDPADPPVVSVDIPEAFYGDYMYLNPAAHEYYFLSIDENGIVASIDMTNNEYVAEILEFDEQDPSTIKVSINGKTFYLYGSVDNMSDEGKYNVITLRNDKTGGDGIEADLLRDGYEPDNGDDTFNVPANFVGVYEGTKNGDDSGTQYVLTVTETGMTLKVGDDEPVKITIKNYETTSSRAKFTVIIKGMGFDSVNYVGNVSTIGDALIQKLYLMGDGTVTFYRVTEADNA